jgi:pyridine nucleotide-disulfide oxidoreductase family protein
MSSDYDLLLVGAGHAHLGVLRLWAEHGRPPGRIALLSEDAHAWYSGMLPGLLSGHYQLDECRIDLRRLCAAIGIQLIEAQACGLELASQCLHLNSGQAPGYRLLSLNTGSRPQLPEQSGRALELLPVKPFGAFISRWQAWQAAAQPLAILGGGAAGVELALALAGRVPALSLLTGQQLLAGHPPRLRQRALRHLAGKGVQVQEHCPVDAVADEHLLSAGRSVWQGRRVLVASGASALPWLQAGGLACDSQGFVLINAQLQSCAHPQVFAAGDCASLPRCPHNGVYAVRQGPVLAHNLAAALAQRPLRSYEPQPRALALLASGDGGALASWAGLTGEGRLFGYWKERLDRGFMRRHRAA